MDIQTRKIALVKAILSIDNNEVLQNIADFMQSKEVDFWNELSAVEKEEIKTGIDQLDKGKRVSLESVLEKIS